MADRKLLSELRKLGLDEADGKALAPFADNPVIKFLADYLSSNSISKEDLAWVAQDDASDVAAAGDQSTDGQQGIKELEEELQELEHELQFYTSTTDSLKRATALAQPIAQARQATCAAHSAVCRATDTEAANRRYEVLQCGQQLDEKLDCLSQAVNTLCHMLRDRASSWLMLATDMRQYDRESVELQAEIARFSGSKPLTAGVHSSIIFSGSLAQGQASVDPFEEVGFGRFLDGLSKEERDAKRSELLRLRHAFALAEQQVTSAMCERDALQAQVDFLRQPGQLRAVMPPQQLQQLVADLTQQRDRMLNQELPQLALRAASHTDVAILLSEAELEHCRAQHRLRRQQTVTERVLQQAAGAKVIQGVRQAELVKLEELSQMVTDIQDLMTAVRAAAEQRCERLDHAAAATSSAAATSAAPAQLDATECSSTSSCVIGDDRYLRHLHAAADPHADVASLSPSASAAAASDAAQAVVRGLASTEAALATCLEVQLPGQLDRTLAAARALQFKVGEHVAMRQAPELTEPRLGAAMAQLASLNAQLREAADGLAATFTSRHSLLDQGQPASSLERSVMSLFFTQPQVLQRRKEELEAQVQSADAAAAGTALPRLQQQQSELGSAALLQVDPGQVQSPPRSAALVLQQQHLQASAPTTDAQEKQQTLANLSALLEDDWTSDDD